MVFPKYATLAAWRQIHRAIDGQWVATLAAPGCARIEEGCRLGRSMKVVFVCAGNICRSPMAAALFSRSARERRSLADVKVTSAGVIAFPGNPATPETADVMREEFDLDLEGHEARLFDHRNDADLVLTLDRWVTARVEALKPSGEVWLLGDFAGSEGEEVADPFGGSPDEYREAAAHIDRLVRAVVEKLDRQTASS